MVGFLNYGFAEDKVIINDNVVLKAAWRPLVGSSSFILNPNLSYPQPTLPIIKKCRFKFKQGKGPVSCIVAAKY